jgi:hypothetical protein
MQTYFVQASVRVGNHALTAEETAAGVPERQPFVDADGLPADPDTVALALLAPTGEQVTFGYPTAGDEDAGALTKESDGRFYADWIPTAEEDGLWRWYLLGQMELGTQRPDQDVFYVARAITLAPVPA